MAEVGTFRASDSYRETEVLSDQELLAMVLRTGTKSESVHLANRILKGMTSLADLSHLSLNELQEILVWACEVY